MIPKETQEKLEEYLKSNTRSDESNTFTNKAYQCEPPCDSYGICSNCYDHHNYGCGYEFGFKAGAKWMHEQLLSHIENLEKMKEVGVEALEDIMNSHRGATWENLRAHKAIQEIEELRNG